MEHFATRIMRECKSATRNFSEQGKFHGTRAIQQTFRQKHKKKKPAHFGVFSPRFFFNCHSLHARLNNHHKTWCYKKKKPKRLKHTGNLFRKNLKLKNVC